MLASKTTLHSFGKPKGAQRIFPKNFEYISIPPKAKIKFTITRKGNNEGNTELKNNFAPVKVYSIQLLGLSIMYTIKAENTKVYIKFLVLELRFRFFINKYKRMMIITMIRNRRLIKKNQSFRKDIIKYI